MLILLINNINISQQPICEKWNVLIKDISAIDYYIKKNIIIIILFCQFFFMLFLLFAHENVKVLLNED